MSIYDTYFHRKITKHHPKSPKNLHGISTSRQALAQVLQVALRRGIDVPEITVLGSGTVDFDEILLPLVRGSTGDPPKIPGKSREGWGERERNHGQMLGK